MRITDIQIDGFGAWSNLDLDHLSEGLTVFYGPNEAGKTTVMEFVRSVLYGFTPDRRSRYLPPLAGGRGGGGLGAVGAGGRFTIRRVPGSLTGEDLGRVEVLSTGGARQGQHVLGTLLSGIDEAIFKNVFAVGLRELQELGTLDDTEAAAHLYKLTSGLDRVSLIDVMRQLEASRNAVLAADGGRSELVELIERREQLQAEVQELSGAGVRWIQLAAQRTELQAEVGRLEENIDRMQAESRAVAVAIQVHQDWLQRAETAEKLAKLGQPVKLPPKAIEQIEELNTQLAVQREEIEQLKRRRRVIVEEISAQPIQRALWDNAGRIEALCEHGPWITSLESQIKRLHDDMELLEKELRAQWEKLGLPPQELPEFTPDMSERARTALRTPARAVQDAQQRLEAVKAEREDARREAESIQEQLRVELAETGEADLEHALATAGQRVTLLRRRIQLEERLDKLDRHRKEMEADRRDLLEEQVLPVSTLIWCGVPFVAGVALILASFFWPSVSNLGWTVTLLGFGCWAIAVVTKLLLEKSLNQELDGCVRQLDKVKRQLDELVEERDELDQQLPAGGGPLDARAATAEKHVQRLEELTPLESRRAAALARAETAKEKAAKTAEELREAQQRWREALRAVGLPDSFRPEHIQQLSDGSDLTFQAGRRLQARRDEAQERQAELAAVTQRIRDLLKELKITAASDDPRTQLRQLAAALAEQRGWMDRRRELQQEHRQVRKQFRETAKAVRQLLKQRRALLHAAGVPDEEALRKLAARQAKIEELSARRDELHQRITLTIGSHCPAEAVAEAIRTHEDRLETYLDRLVSRLQEAQSRLTQLHEQRGQMIQEMKTLADDRRLPETRLKLGCVEEQLHRAVHRWRVLGVTSLMLEAIRQIYETERQPETLAEASTYLERLTEGRYRRIWTPLSEDILRVDTADGQSLSLEVLSQGTREAVFLSLRMALAAAYARRGALLPLILDDVLVNFDTRRARAAAEVLRDFAHGGHQMLLFTCHHHILRIFQAASVETRLLPVREGLDQSQWIELDEAKPPAPLPAQDDPGEEIAEIEEEEIEAEVEEEIEEESPEVVAEEPEEVEEPEEIAEPDEVAAAAEEEDEEPEEGLPYSLWEESELRLADEDADDELETLAVGASGRSSVRDRWWETDSA